jgi:hemoglobin
MARPAKLYHLIGGAAGCHSLAAAFYAHVEQDPVLRPFFPSTFTCAIEEFAAFLVQFLGWDPEATQRRWWLSLKESHNRFPIGLRERDAWLKAMAATLDNGTLIADAAVRAELLSFFRHSSAYVVNQEPVPDPPSSLDGELAPLWNEQLALDELAGSVLRDRFVRSPSVHASVIALAAASAIPAVREYALQELIGNPALVHARYKHGRTLLHDAAAAGDAVLVRQLLDLGAAGLVGDGRTPSLCIASRMSAAPRVQATLSASSCKKNRQPFMLLTG